MSAAPALKCEHRRLGAGCGGADDDALNLDELGHFCRTEASHGLWIGARLEGDLEGRDGVAVRAGLEQDLRSLAGAGLEDGHVRRRLRQDPVRQVRAVAVEVVQVNFQPVLLQVEVLPELFAASPGKWLVGRERKTEW